MDYTDDVAMFMFTAGQVTRMQATLDGLRSSIGTSVSCGKTLVKDPPKELPKDLVKDLPKDGVKELPKDRPKEFVKELAKDPGLEPGKSLVGDLPPKSVFDPPKSFMEPPVDIPLPEGGVVWPATGPLVAPGIAVGPLAGGGALGPGAATPFVLATGTGAGGPLAGGGVPGFGSAGFGHAGVGREQTTALANAYLQLLIHYTRLHAMGQLDAAGMAAWHQVIADYSRVVSGS
jgi:hypothetical protein